jgi:putative ABC transport system permease protein
VSSGREPAASGEVAVDADAAADAGLRIGDPVRIAAMPGTYPATVVALVRVAAPHPGRTFVYVAPGDAAPRLLGRPDRVTDVAVDAAPGVSPGALKAAIVTELARGGRDRP